MKSSRLQIWNVKLLPEKLQHCKRWNAVAVVGKLILLGLFVFVEFLCFLTFKRIMIYTIEKLKLVIQHGSIMDLVKIQM